MKWKLALQSFDDTVSYYQWDSAKSSLLEFQQ